MKVVSNTPPKLRQFCSGLGFDKETWSMETSKLSGGQQNRLGLARLLLAAPDVLLLDEPTNHLDVHAVEWLEEFLQSYQSAYVIVSHDRYFLDQSCRRIIELENGKAASYTGNYSSFLIEREERREAQQRAYDNQATANRQNTRVYSAKPRWTKDEASQVTPNDVGETRAGRCRCGVINRRETFVFRPLSEPVIMF
jgi:ATP-binding cassette subfamily F protein 3